MLGCLLHDIAGAISSFPVFQFSLFFPFFFFFHFSLSVSFSRVLNMLFLLASIASRFLVTFLSKNQFFSRLGGGGVGVEGVLLL